MEKIYQAVLVSLAIQLCVLNSRGFDATPPGSSGAKDGVTPSVCTSRDCTMCNFPMSDRQIRCHGCQCIPTDFPNTTLALTVTLSNLGNLTRADFKHLPLLINLTLTSCNIRSISPETFDDLVQLRSLNLRTNMGVDGLSSSLFANLKNLRSLDLTRTTKTCEFIEDFTLDAEAFIYTWNQLTRFPSFIVPSRNESRFPRLTLLDFEGNNIKTIRGKDLLGLETVEVLILRQNRIFTIKSGAFQYLTRLTQLDLDLNPLRNLESDSFASTSLTHLSLVRTDYWRNGKYGLFQNTTNLTFLNISRSYEIMLAAFPFKELTKLRNFSTQSNELTDEMVSNITENLPGLQYFDLNDNNLNVLENVSFHLLKNLSVLLVAENWLITVNATSLPPRLWKNLDEVDFSANPLTCDCGIVWFRRWLNKTTKIVVDHRDLIVCAAPADVKRRRLEKVVHPTDMECFRADPDWMLFVVTFIALAVSATATVISILHRFRWNIKYWYFQYNVRTDESNNEDDRHYQFDAFVSYDVSDSTWVIQELLPHLETEYGLNLCIRQRNWLLGFDIAENVSDSIRCSRKTVLVVSNAFAISHWCHFELTMAQTFLYEDNRDNLVLVLLEEISDGNMNPRLRLQMQKNPYVEWTQHYIGQRLFWATLKRAINKQCRSPVQMNPPRKLFRSVRRS